VDLQLLDSATTEVVTASQHDFEVALGFQIVGDFGERCRFADYVYTDKRDRVDLTTLLGCKCFFQDVNVALRCH